MTWRPAADSPPLDNVNLERIAGGGIRFVAIGCRIYRGACVADGAWVGTDVGLAPWTATGTEAFAGATLTDIAWGPLRGFLVVGDVAGAPRAWASPDGATWSAVAISPDATAFTAVAAADGPGYLALGVTAAGPHAWESDGRGLQSGWRSAGSFPDATPGSVAFDAAWHAGRWHVTGFVEVDAETGSEWYSWALSPQSPWAVDRAGLEAAGDLARLVSVGDRLIGHGRPCARGSQCVSPTLVRGPSGQWADAFPTPPGQPPLAPEALAGSGDDIVAFGDGLAILTTATLPTPPTQPDGVGAVQQLTGAGGARLPRSATPAAAAGGPNDDLFVFWSGSRAGSLEVDRFDVHASTWARRATAPALLFDPVVVSGRDGRLYLTGVSADGRSAPLYAYDIKRDRWQLRTSLPLGRRSPALATIGGRLYVFGGSLLAPSGSLSAGEQTPRVDVLDLGTGRWTRGTPMPAIADRFSALALNKIHDAETNVVIEPGTQIVVLLPGRAWHYDTIDGTWTAGGPTLQQGMSGPAAIASNNAIFVFGCDRIDAYDPSLRAWHAHADLDVARCDPVVAVPDSGAIIAALGGEGEGEIQAPMLSLFIGGG